MTIYLPPSIKGEILFDTLSLNRGTTIFILVFRISLHHPYALSWNEKPSSLKKTGLNALRPVPNP
ncbi:MAG: hypothetical protein B1H12_02960 [Desulfobacteraceae bacterium 4484_190.2]|nr:MAG: hypothetical protein B1H12_02960 [Desulfobacteraceae bacterium 4484_190.2]